MARSLLLTAACGVLISALVARAEMSPQVPAQVPGQTEAPTDDGKLFAKIYPVFAHPRCANCHGVAQSFPGFIYSVTPESHPGGPEGIPDLPKPTVDCDQCHDDDALGGKWKKLAPFNLEWAGMGEDQVCVMEAAEVRLMNKEAGGAGANLRKSYLHHLATDVLIQQAWGGYAGGARSQLDEQKRPNPKLPVPPLSYREFLDAAEKWVEAGAPCRATGQVSLVEEQQTAYFVNDFGGQKLSFSQNANRDVNIVRYRDGSAAATVTASGWDQTVTTLDSGGCTVVTKVRNEWSRVGPAKVDAQLRFTVKPDEYTIHLVLPEEQTRGRQTFVQTNTCGPGLSFPESSTELDWPVFIMTLRCPTAFPDNDGTMGCFPTEPHDKGTANGTLDQTVKNAGSDAAEPRSWLYRSPMAIARIDNGEGLPVIVRATWSFRTDQK